MSTVVDSGVTMGVNNLRAMIAAWANASLRSIRVVGGGMNSSGQVRSVKHFERSDGPETALVRT